MRSKKAMYNIFASVFSQIVSIICGFVLPRLILSRFGSDYNGITNSISQFLSVVALMRSGVGGATRAALYKSLAQEDLYKTSSIIRATEIFMRRVALLFAAFAVSFSFIYPFFVKDEFDWLFSATLVLIISLSTFVQYYFGITYQMLLQADQRQYIYSLLHCLTVVLNTIVASLLIKLGFGIHFVKAGSAIVFCISPLFLNIYVRNKYKLNRTVEPDFSAISQRWDALFHQIASFIHSNTDVVLLTIFTNIKEVSVYSVYCMVSNGMRTAVYTVITGVEAAFGNIIAKNEKLALNRNIDSFETLLHFILGSIFSVAFVFITPFIKMYTSGINDVSYERYLFGYLLLISEFLFCARVPYESVINAAGHYKPTKKYTLFEAVINLVLSMLLVKKYSLVGIIIGTIVSIAYRTVAFSYYLSQNIAFRKLSKTFKRYIITTANVLIVILCAKLLNYEAVSSLYHLIIQASTLTIVSVVLNLLMNLIFFRNEFNDIVTKIINVFKTFVLSYKKKS